MSNVSIAWVAIAVLFVLRAIIAYDRSVLHSRIIKESEKGKRVIRFLLVIIFCLFTIVNTNYTSYSLMDDKQDCTDYHLP